MLSGYEILYIEFGSDTLEILTPVLFGLAFILIMYLGIKANMRNSSESNHSRDSKLPVYLFRAHVARFVISTKHKYDEIEDMYIKYMKKFAFIYRIDQKYELNQLQFLIDNNVNIEQTIKVGRKESHKKRLLILIFLFNVSIKTGEISEDDLFYLDNVYNDLGLSQAVYLKIKSAYFIEDTKNFNEQNKNISISSYRLYKAYKVLNLPVNTDFKIVKNTYRNLVKKYHPDVYKEKDIKSKEFALIKFNEITDAYKTIKEIRFIKK